MKNDIRQVSIHSWAEGGGRESPIPAWRHAEAEVVVGLARWHADVGGVADG